MVIQLDDYVKIGGRAEIPVQDDRHAARNEVTYLRLTGRFEDIFDLADHVLPPGVSTECRCRQAVARWHP